MISDLFFQVMYVIDKSSEISDEIVFMNKMAHIKRYKTVNFAGETANFVNNTSGIS